MPEPCPQGHPVAARSDWANKIAARRTLRPVAEAGLAGDVRVQRFHLAPVPPRVLALWVQEAAGVDVGSNGLPALVGVGEPHLAGGDKA